MRKTIRKALALFLCLTMCMGLFPAVYAEDDVELLEEEEIYFDNGADAEEELIAWIDDTPEDGASALRDEAPIPGTAGDEILPEDAAFDNEGGAAAGGADADEDGLLPAEDGIVLEEESSPVSNAAADAAEGAVLLTAGETELPAAEEDGTEANSGDSEDLLAAIDSFLAGSGASSYTFTGRMGAPNQGLTLTIPEGFTLNITEGFLCLDALTVDGQINVTGSAQLIVDNVLDGTGSVSIDPDCSAHLPAGLYSDGALTAPVAAGYNPYNITLIHTPANYDELAAAVELTGAAVAYGFESGIVLKQDITLQQGQNVILGDENRQPIAGLEGISIQHGSTLTVESGAVFIACELRVDGGNVVNRGDLKLGKTTLNPGHIVFDGGRFEGDRIIVYVKDENGPDSCIQGINLGLFIKNYDEENNRYIYYFRPNEATYAALIAACEAAADSEELSRFQIPGAAGLTITDNLTIPANLSVEALGATIQVAAGVELNIDGKLMTGSFANNGEVNVGANGFLYAEAAFDIGSGAVLNLAGELSVEHEAIENEQGQLVLPAVTYSSDDALLDISYNIPYDAVGSADLTAFAGEHLRKSVWVIGGLWETDEDVTLPAGVRLCVPGDYNSALVIGEGKTFTIADGGDLFVRGKSVVRVNGALVNNGVIMLSWKNDSIPQIVLGENGSYSGSGTAWRDGSPYAVPGYNAEFNALRAAIDAYMEGSGPNEYDLRNKGAFTFAGDLVIPEGFTVRAAATFITVPEGSALIIYGTLNCGFITVDGLVNVYDRGRLNTQGPGTQVNGAINCYGNGSADLVEVDPGLLGTHLNYSDKGIFRFRFYADNAADIAAIKAQCDEIFVSDHVNGMIHVNFDWTPAENLYFDREGLVIGRYYVDGVEHLGTLTIPNGVELTAVSINVEGTTLTVQSGGSLVNEYNLYLEENYADYYAPHGRLIVEDGGSYSGRGVIIVKGTDDPDSMITGLTIGENGSLSKTADEYRTYYTYTESIAAYFYAALADEDTHYIEMRNLGDFVLRGDENGEIHIPGGKEFESYGTRFVVPAGVTLIVDEGAEFGHHALWVQEGASVFVCDGAVLNVYESCTLDGTIEAARDARLHITLRETGFPFGNIHVAEGYENETWFHYEPADAEQVFEMLEEADGLHLINDRFWSNIRILFPWTVTSPVTFGAPTGDGWTHTHLEVWGDHEHTGSVTVGDGGVLTLNYYTNFHCADLTVEDGGAVINNEEIEFTGISAQMPTGVLSVEEGGSYGGGGWIAISAGDNHDDHIQGLEGLIVSYDNNRSIYRLTGAVLQALRDAIDDGRDYFNLRDCGVLTLDEGEYLVIPDYMHVEGWGTALVVPESATLSVEGTLQLSGLEIDGAVNMGIAEEDWGNRSELSVSDELRFGEAGALNIGTSAYANLPVADVDEYVMENKIVFASGLDNWVTLCYKTWDEDDLYYALGDMGELPEKYGYNIEIRFPWTLDDNVNFASGVSLYVEGAWNGASITVPAGVTLTLNDYMNLNSATITVYGTLINNGRIDMNRDENGEVNNGFSCLDFKEGGAYGGYGEISMPAEAGDFANSVKGVSEDQFYCTYADEWWRNYTFASAAMNYLLNAINEGWGYVNLDNFGPAELDFGTLDLGEGNRFVIPDELHVDAWNATFVVPAGVTLDVQGELNVGNLVVDGDVVMGKAPDPEDPYSYGGDNSILNVGNALTFGQNGSIGVGWYANASFPGAGMTAADMQKIGLLGADQGEDCRNWVTFNYSADYNENEIYAAMAEIEDLPAPFNGNIEIRFPWTLDNNVSFKPGTSLYVEGAWDDGAITVPAGVTLTLNGFTNINGAALTVNGTLINNDRIELNRGENDGEYSDFGRIDIMDGGVYDGGGEIGVRSETSIEDCTTGLPLELFVCTYNDDWWTNYRYVGNLLDALRGKIEEAERNPDEHYTFELNDRGDFEIDGDLYIPRNLYVEAWGTNLIIPENTSITVEGDLNADSLTVNGTLALEGNGFAYAGTVSVDGESGWINLRDWAQLHTEYDTSIGIMDSGRVGFNDFDTDAVVFMKDVNTNNQFKSFWTTFKGFTGNYIGKMRVCYDLTIAVNRDAAADHPVQIEIKGNQNASLTIKEGVTFRAAFLDLNGADMTVNGKLISTEEVLLQADGDEFPTGTITFANDACYENDGGYIFVRDTEDDTNNHIQGLNLSRFSCVPRDNGMVYMDNSARFADFKAACQRGDSYCDLRDLGSLTISESVTLPAGMTAEAWNTVLIIPNGVTLTVGGKLQANGLVVEDGGKVILDTGINGNPGANGNPGTMDIHGSINLNTSGSLELRNRAQIDASIYAWKDLNLDRVTFGENTFFFGHYDVNNMDELRDAYDDILSNKLNEQPHLEPFVEVFFPYEVSDIDSVIPNTRLRMHAGMHLPAGKTFTVYHGVLAIFEKNLVIDGTLVNNGIVNLNGPVAVLGANGVYTEGEDARGIFRNGQPFTFKSNAEILAELEQAVANGDHYSLTNYGDFVLPNGLTIDHRFFFECWGTNVIVPAGQTLRVKSGARLEMHCLIVEEGANVIVEDGGQLKVYNFLEGDGLITLGNDVYASLPANYTPAVNYGDDCDIKLKYRANTRQELYAMKAEAEALQYPFYGDLNVQFDWNITNDITFNNVHLSLDHANTQNNRSITVSNGGRLTLNAGIWIKCADLTVNGGTVVNNSEIELCNDGDGETGVLRLINGGSYEGGGRVVVRDIWGEDDPDSHIVGVNGLSRNDDGDGRYIYINAGAIMDDLRSAISNGRTYYDLRSCGTLTLDENETLVIPEGMRIDAWGTTLVVPESATLNVTGEYNGTGLALYGQLLTGKPSVDWSRPMSSMYIRDYLTLGENAHISVGFQSSLGLPGDVLTDEVLSGMIQKVGTDQWITLNWNAFDAAAVSDALTRAGTLSDGYNCHADIRFNWVVDGEVELPNNLDLFVDAAYNEGCITVPAGAKLINNSYINLNGASVNVAGELENNGTINISYDEYGPLYSGYGSVNVTGSYTGGGELCAPKSGNLDEMITGLDLRYFTTSYDEWEDGSVHLVYADAILNGLRSAIQQANNNPGGYYEYWDLGDYGTIPLDDNFTIPQNMKVIAWGTTVVVPEGKTLNVVGEFEVSGMELNGSLVMGRPSADDEQDSRIHISDSMTIGPDAGITVGLRSRLEVPAYAMTDSVIENQVWRTSDNWITLNYTPQNANELYTAISRELPDDYGGHADLRFNWVVDGERELPDNFSIYVNGRENGAITIPQGAQLTLNRYMSVNPATVITVSGSLVNNGHIDFDEENGACGQIVFNGGSYGGAGELGIPYGMLSQALSGSIDLSKFIPGDDLGWGTVYTYADAADRAELLVGSAKLRRGAQTTVSVTLSEGTGAEVMQFVLGYDSDVLRVVSATAGELLSSAPTINKDIPGLITFNVDNSPLTDGGSLLDITFEAIAEATSNEAQIWIITDSEDDRDELIVRRYADNQSIDIPVNCIDGTISIVDYTLGDINDDGEINVKDAFMIRKYQARMINLTATERNAADVNGDNKVNIDDAGLIRRYAIDVIDSFPAA